MMYHIQPYFVLNTKKYKKFIPTNSPIMHFYQFTCGKTEPLNNSAIPDGMVDLIFDLDEQVAILAGSVRKYTASFFLTGHTYFGIRLKPGLRENYGEISILELIDNTVSFSEVINIPKINNIFDKKKVFIDKVSIIYEYLLPQLGKTNLAPNIIKELLMQIYLHKGNISLSYLKKTFSYSERHLLRLFKKYVGLDIKSFCRIVRFQSVLAEINKKIKNKETITYSQMIYRYGYYDMPHFQKEFKLFSFVLPRVYEKHLINNQYYERITIEKLI